MTQKPRCSAAISRRSLGRMVLTLQLDRLFPSRLHAMAAPVLEVDRFLDGLAGPASGKISCSYRADAVIVLLSFPIFRRTGVGGGFASLVDLVRDNDRYYSLRFAGASRPDRAAGLDRVGAIREVAVERGSVLTEAAYFGVLTTSPEETLEEGRRSLGKNGTDWNEYTAINGQSRRGFTRSAITHFRLPSAGGPNLHVIAEARANFQTNRPALRENQWPGRGDGQAPPTFLYALMKAIRCQKRETEAWYVYSERSYHLWLEKQLDRREGHRFAGLGLTSHPDRIIEVRGRIREESSGRQNSFRLWVEDGSSNALPLRIEFQPRSYLRLSFEVDPQASPTRLEEDL